MEESELIKRIAKGDKNAFTEIVDKHKSMIINLCYRYLHNKEDAEEVAQDVFIELWHSASKFRGQSKISTWLYKVASNRSIDYIRKNKKRENDIEIDKAYRLSSFSNPHLTMEEKEKGQIIIKSIQALSANQQEAFVLAKFEDKSYTEIAEIMNKSVSSVESLIFRAGKKLKEKMKHYKK